MGGHRYRKRMKDACVPQVDFGLFAALGRHPAADDARQHARTGRAHPIAFCLNNACRHQALIDVSTIRPRPSAVVQKPGEVRQVRGRGNTIDVARTGKSSRSPTKPRYGCPKVSGTWLLLRQRSEKSAIQRPQSSSTSPGTPQQDRGACGDSSRREARNSLCGFSVVLREIVVCCRKLSQLPARQRRERTLLKPSMVSILPMTTRVPPPRRANRNHASGVRMPEPSFWPDPFFLYRAQ